MIINIYTIGKSQEIAHGVKVKSIYDCKFYHRNVATLGKAKSREIIRKANNNILTDKIYLIFENTETGRTGAQYIYKNGTILNF